MIRGLMADNAAVLTSDAGEIVDAFGAGQMLFAIRSSSQYPRFMRQVERSAAFQWQVAAIPQMGATPVVNIYGASIAVCRSTEQQQLAAWIFLKWFTEPKQQAAWVKATNYFPVRRSTAREYTPYLRTAYNLLENGKSEPTGVWYDPVRGMLSAAMAEILAGGDMNQILSRIDWEANNLLGAARRGS
jgi:ABC-type glycerol-3-phosphate transport system substrate-binding protein